MQYISGPGLVISQITCRRVQHMESLLFGLISCFQISTSVLTVPVKMEQRVSTLKEVISASVNLDLMESSVNKASCL